MIAVKRISHATLETPDLERQIDYYVNIVGLVLVAQDKDRALFASRLGHLAIVLQRGAHARLARLAFQVAPGTELAPLVIKLSGEGIAATVRHDDLPGVAQVLSFADPKGTMVDVFSDARPAAAASDPGGVAPLKLGHVSYQLPDIHPAIAFYQKVLGFRISDWQEDFFCFMRCGADHHTINFATSKSSKLHHFAFELKDWAHVQVACDHLGRNGVPIIWGPGRHGISHNIFTYHRNPDDLMVEFYTEMDQMTDEELGYFEPRPWHKEFPMRPKVWDRKSAALVWGPPQGPDHARQRME
jgi:catechol 2,3-dioxygenase-like lactoylglutathione lyase family enzyme